MSKQQADPAYIRKVLGYLFEPGQVAELRILKTRYKTVSGYFDNMVTLANTASEWSGQAPGVYVTLNPVTPTLLARVNNRVEHYVETTSRDGDILRRRWLPIDVDPNRPAGISSSNEEHNQAIETAKIIGRFLLGLGIPKDSIILADSGNGAHILIRIDLPNDDASRDLLKHCIQAVALHFGTKDMIIDQEVFNAARIWKLYGTLARKGDNMPNRSHRLSTIIYTPAHITVCPLAPLEALAKLAPEEEVRPNFNGTGNFNLESWMSQHGIGIRNQHPWGGGTIHILDHCYFNSEHEVDAATYVIRHASGALAAGCKHSRCHGKGWHELRNIVEPGWREKKSDRHQRHSGNGDSNSQGLTSEQAGKHHFTLVSAKDVLAAEDDETSSWLWDGILPTDGMSLVVAKPKVGKTTLAFGLAVAVARGNEFLNRKTEQGPVVYLALEEKKGEIKKKLKNAGVTDEPLFFHFGSAPLDALQQVEPLIVETQAKLLVIDVLQKFCRIKDLNDYAQVTNTLEPLMAAARKRGCHNLLTHHAGKVDRPDGDDILGSTGLLGGVDTSIHIKKRDQHRTFSTIQRYGEDTPETVIQLREDGSLESIGSREEVEIEEAGTLILAALKDLKQGDSLTVEELGERVEKRKARVLEALRLLIKKEQITRSGSGKRKDPYKYSVPPFPDTNGNSGTESKNADNQAESKGECHFGDFSQNEKGGNGMGTGSSQQQNGPKGPSFSPGNGVDSNGFNWETGEQERSRDCIEKEDDDGFEDVRK